MEAGLGRVIGGVLRLAVCLVLAAGCAAPRLLESEVRESVPGPVRLEGGERDTVRLVVYGDNRLSRALTDRNYNSSRRTRRRAITSAIAADSVDFVVHTGDLVERADDPFLWTAFKQDTKPLLRKRFFYPTTGNHEYKGEFTQAFYQVAPEIVQNTKSYAFRAGPIYLIVWDSMVEPHPSDPNSFHGAWFRARLREAADAPFLFVVSHHPLFSSGRGRIARFAISAGKVGHAPRGRDKLLRAVLADDLNAKQKRIPHARTVVFNGHSHFYERYEHDGVTYVTTGGGGAPAHEPKREMDHRVAAYRGDHYVRVTLTETDVELQMVPVGMGRWVQTPLSSDN